MSFSSRGRRDNEVCTKEKVAVRNYSCTVCLYVYVERDGNGDWERGQVGRRCE